MFSLKTPSCDQEKLTFRYALPHTLVGDADISFGETREESWVGAYLFILGEVRRGMDGLGCGMDSLQGDAVGN